jgi:dienelactone hydrolase
MTDLVTPVPRALVALRRPVWLVTLGHVVGAGVDGLVVGLVVGYCVVTGVTAPTQHLGIPAPVAMLVVGALVAAVALAGAGVGLLVTRSAGWIGARLRSVGDGRTVRAVTSAVSWPFRLVGRLPGGWIGALLALIWLASEGRLVAPVGFLVPPGMLSTFIYLGAIVFALTAMARAAWPGHRLVAAGLGAVALLLGGASLVYGVWPGPTDHLVPADAAYAGPVIDTDLEDPGSPGPYPVETLSYGSGHDVRRPPFGADAAILTPTVDAARFLPRLGAGSDEARAWWWGFGTDALPLNGLVWAPQGEGPFPLVLVVHGNHAMGDFSESGYAYLGEHLASRGFVTVSVDEDFLNGSWADDWEGDEQAVRAWLLLLHIDQWRAWAADPGSRFHGRVDLDRVALIGHSRGGEAASVAAMLATTERAPRTGMDPWPTGLDVDAVVSIAPSDSQYSSLVNLEGVDFLTIQGGHDADARSWSGIRQYARTTTDETGFKAAIWSYRANHGRFNTAWGGDDQGPFSGAQLDLAPLLTAEAQEDLSKTAIGAFLEASLHGRDGYRGFFARPAVGAEWLTAAHDIVLVRSTDGMVHPLTAISPDRPVDGLTLTTDGFTTTHAMVVPLRALQPDQRGTAVNARWSAGASAATWALGGIGGLDLGLRGGSTLRVALADGRDPGARPLDPLDLAIEVVDVDGTAVALPLDGVGRLPPPLPVRLVKDERLVVTTTIDLSLRSPVERVLQTYAIPLAMFEAADPAFSSADLETVRLRIGRSEPGALWIADAGLRP